MRLATTAARRAGRAAAGTLLLGSPVLARAAAAAAGEEGGNPLTRFDPGLMIWTVLTFIALVVLLRWKAWPVIVRALRAREEAVRESIAQARREREEAEKLLEQHRQMIADTRRETASLLDQGRQHAERLRGEILDKARVEQREILEQGRRQIQHETRAAVDQLRTQAVDLALAASEKLLRRSLDEEAHKRLVEETIRELSGPEGGKGPRPS